MDEFVECRIAAESCKSGLAWRRANVERELKSDFVAVDHDISYGAACSVSIVSRAMSNKHDYAPTDRDQLRHDPD